MKVLQLLKAAVTHLFSHGAACKRCKKHYEQIIKPLDDILVKNPNAEWIVYQSSLLKPTTVLQIMFLEDQLVINGLCLLLQSNKKDFKQFSELLIQSSQFPRKLRRRFNLFEKFQAI